MATNTTNYSIPKPAVNDPTDADLWGTELNSGMDIIDAQLKVATDTIHATLTGNTTIDSTYRNKIILCDATAAPFTVTLQAAATAGDGFTCIIKKTDVTSNAVTIAANGAEKIDASNTQVASSQYNTYEIICDGTKWQIVTSPSTSPVTSVAGKTGAVTLALADIGDWPGFGTTGTKAIQLTGGILPAVDGSLLTNIPGVATVVNSSTGKIVFSTVTIQWGSATASPAGVTVSYGTAFSSAPYSVVVTMRDTTNGTSASSLTASTFVAKQSAGGGVCYWIAIGPT